MIEYTYFEIFLMCAFFVALGYALKYREESLSARKFIRALVNEPELYAKFKKDHDDFVKEIKNAN